MYMYIYIYKYLSVCHARIKKNSVLFSYFRLYSYLIPKKGSLICLAVTEVKYNFILA